LHTAADSILGPPRVVGRRVCCCIQNTDATLLAVYQGFERVIFLIPV
jgi:hypothetical protein